VRRPGIRTLAALLIRREQVIKPVLAGVCGPKHGRPPKILHLLGVHYQNLQSEMLATLQTLKLAACRLHGDGSVVLRLGLGFPGLVFARRSTQLEHRHPAARALVVASGVGSDGTITTFWCSQPSIHTKTCSSNSAGYRHSQTPCLNRFATLLTTSSLGRG
jgi:hypothetical protein